MSDHYFSNPRLNFSAAKHLAQSPLAFKHYRDNGRPDKASYSIGRGAHAATLEPDRFRDQYVVYPGAVRRGKEWDSFAASNADREILKADEHARCLAIAAAVHRHPIAAELLSSGVAESAIEWTDSETGLELKARPDFVSDASRGACVELKTAADISPRKFAASVAGYFYHVQLAWYLAGLAATGRTSITRGVIIAVESAAPHDVAVYELGEDALYRGQVQMRDWLKLLVECKRTGLWPGRAPDAVQELELPRWAWPDEDQMESTEPDWMKGAVA